MENLVQIQFRVLMKYLCIFILMVHCVTYGAVVNSSLSKHDSDGVTLSQTTSVRDITDEQSKYFQNLIYILKELQYFNIDGNKSGCFSLRQIEKAVKHSETNSKQIGIHLYFDEIDISSESSSVFAQNMKESNSDRYTSARFMAGDCNTLPVTFQDITGLPGLDKMSRKQVDGNEADSNENATKDNKTEVAAVIPQPVDDQGEEDDKQKGLSRTQVIVIATCSAVIGTFFIIAGAMRVHSCLKRYRENRDNILGIGRRTRGFVEPGSLRRESAASKASRQSHPASKAGSDSQINRNGRSPPSLTHNSPQHCSDQNQLLPVNTEGQFSDGNSSHGSLAYIDEETFRKTKASSHHSGSEYGSEDDPLLRKSPDSGSSVDVNMGDDDDEEKNECATSQYTGVTSCGRTSSSSKIDDITPSRIDAFEPSSDIDSTNSVNENLTDKGIVPDENKPIAESKKIVESPVENHNDLVDANNDSVGTKEDKNNTNKQTNTPDSDGAEKPNELQNVANERKTSITSLTQKTIPKLSKKLPKAQFSVDYFDVDDNGVEIINPIFEESDDELPLSENMAVTVGLTQSDSSLSNNPSYSYGNQTAYDVDPGYGQYGYCNPYVYETDNNIHLNGPDFISNTLRNSVLLSAENLRRANGDSLTMADSFEDSYQNDSIRRRESLNDDYNRSKVSRMLSTDSYFTKTKRPLKAEYSSPPADDTSDSQSTTGTVKLHIVPLAEYHRNSLKESSLEDGDENV